MLDFNENGEAIEKYQQKGNNWKYLRAAVSIEIYGLNDWEPFRKGRKSVWKECYRKIKRINEKFNRAITACSTELVDELSNDIEFLSKELKEKIDIESQYSSVALSCINNCGYEWVDDLIFS